MVGILRAGGGRQEVTELKVPQRYRVSVYELFEVNVACFLWLQSLKFLVGDDDILVLINCISAHDFVCIEIFPGLLSVIFARERLTIRSQHTQRGAIRTRRRKQIYRHTYESKR